MSKRPKRPNVPVIQELLDQLSYDDFIAMIAILGDKHPLGAVKQVQALDNGKHAVIFIRSFPSLAAATNIVDAIDRAGG